MEPKKPEDDTQLTLGTVLQQSRENAQQIREVSDRLDKFAASISASFESMSQRMSQSQETMSLRIGKSQRTDWQTIFIGCSLVISILAVPMWFLNRAQENSDTSHKEQKLELDTKLQREFTLALETQKEGLASMNAATKERREDLLRAIDANRDRLTALEAWNRDSIRADLEELRQWRMKSKADPPK